MKAITFVVPLIFGVIVSCSVPTRLLKLKMEVYYNVFDAALGNHVYLCRAMLRIPCSHIEKKEIDDAVTIYFLNRGKELSYSSICDSVSVRNKYYLLKGKIVGYSKITSAGFITLDFFPLKINAERFRALKYEKNTCKFIYIYFKETPDRKLIFTDYKLVENTNREPVMFK